MGTYADLTDLFCTQVECPLVVGNTLVFRDDNHLTVEYASRAGPRGPGADRPLAARGGGGSGLLGVHQLVHLGRTLGLGLLLVPLLLDGLAAGLLRRRLVWGLVTHGVLPHREPGGLRARDATPARVPGGSGASCAQGGFGPIASRTQSRGDAAGRYRPPAHLGGPANYPDGTFAAVGCWGVHVASPTPLDRSPGRRRCGVSATRPGGRPRPVRLVRGPRVRMRRLAAA